MNDRLTLSPGLRFERNRGSVPAQANVFRTDTIAPRIGAAWDLGTAHRTVARVHYGHYFDPIFSSRIMGEDTSDENTYFVYEWQQDHLGRIQPVPSAGQLRHRPRARTLPRQAVHRRRRARAVPRRVGTGPVHLAALRHLHGHDRHGVDLRTDTAARPRPRRRTRHGRRRRHDRRVRADEPRQRVQRVRQPGRCVQQVRRRAVRHPQALLAQLAAAGLLHLVEEPRAPWATAGT